jgi:hypothetical protein
MAIENKASITTNRKIVPTKLIPTKVKAKHTNETQSGPLLSNLETSQPEATVPASAAKGITNKIDPSCASLRLKDALIVGIREAQDAKHKPERKK